MCTALTAELSALTPRELALKQGWSEERYDRDLKWRRTGFLERRVDRSAIAFMGAAYTFFFDEDPPWFIFEPNELEVMLSLSASEKLRASAAALEVLVAELVERGDVPREKSVVLDPKIREWRANAVLLDQRSSHPDISTVLRTRVARSRQPRRRRVARRVARARSPGRLSEDADPDLALERVP